MALRAAKGKWMDALGGSWLVDSRGGHATRRWSFLDAAAACASHPRRCCFGMHASGRSKSGWFEGTAGSMVAALDDSRSTALLLCNLPTRIIPSRSLFLPTYSTGLFRAAVPAAPRTAARRPMSVWSPLVNKPYEVCGFVEDGLGG